MEFESRLKAYADAVDDRLRSLLPSADSRPFELHAAMRYSCLAPGKRLRPALCLASAEAVIGLQGSADLAISGPSVLDAACAIEMVHCFSLIHDDLPALDDDDLRRGLPTCHKQFGEAIAILAGDALLALAFDTMAQLPPAHGRILAAIRELTRATGSNGLAGGEAVDILSEGQTVDAETLAFIHRQKTGSLIAASCAIGGILAGGSDEEVDRLRAFGEKLGLAFQIADDVLNETSSPSELGKSAGSDRARQKATYPALFGLDASRRMAAEAAQAAVDCLESPTGLLAEFAEFAVGRSR